MLRHDLGFPGPIITDSLGMEGLRLTLDSAEAAWRAVALLPRPALHVCPTTRLAFEFLILTATRSSEVRGAVWTEFDLDGAIWNIPKERMMKSRKPHRVPLNERCMAILRAARALNPDGVLVFEGTKKGRPLSDMTLTKLLRDVGLGERATAHGFRSSFKNLACPSERYQSLS
jgi:integrase